MSEITVTFLHPVDGHSIEVELDSDMTASEAIEELISNDFIRSCDEGYRLSIRGGNEILYDQSFDVAGVQTGTSLLVVPQTDAGGGIPGLDTNSVKNFSIDEVRNSPPAFAMIVHLYNELQEKYGAQSKLYNIEKMKSNDRFISSMLLLVSQVIIAVGVSILVTEKEIAIIVIGAGILQALLAVWLSFRKVGT